ncbi:MAG TPA: hypothetical protein PKN57_09675 [Saprospiraceae bacterium]|nr:hypothetical protein [Saprospiraceae bacterium]MCC6688688.1 hypothetical protein [Saprospiraceae bacterium]HMW75908.1 hypothetical protein [Saprospiraceae bacterium]HMX84197.1 hypothetical protein [Saprospiraceae bacterium]HMX86104.1 hypothetical protein [Saprospiraceae bacterium]
MKKLITGIILIVSSFVNTSHVTACSLSFSEYFKNLQYSQQHSRLLSHCVNDSNITDLNYYPEDDTNETNDKTSSCDSVIFPDNRHKYVYPLNGYSYNFVFSSLRLHTSLPIYLLNEVFII